MKAQLSPLILLDFAIINSNFKFTAPPQNTDVRKLLSDYLLDIDFVIVQHDDATRIFIKTAINQGETEMPGYFIFAEGVPVFKLSKTMTLSDEDKESLLHYSAVSIAINSLRGFILSLTANAPFGKYMLPSIDVNNLFQQKLANANSGIPNKKEKIAKKN